MKNYQIVAKTLQNLEPLLAEELKGLGAKNIKILKRAVSFDGDDETLYRCNLCSRIAISFLVPIHSGEVTNENELYELVYAMPWEDILNPDKTLAIDAAISGQLFNHSQYVALKTKDAIVDKLRKHFGYRPDIDVKTPDFKVNIHIYGSTCTISLDSTGQTLDKRGYRLESGKAPLNEVLAAGMILLSGWTGNKDFYDPMAGSGTYAIEAALIAANIAPGVNRSFCFQNWFDYDYKLFIGLKEELISKQIVPTHQIYTSDIDENNLEYIRSNAHRAEVLSYLRIEKADFFNLQPKSEDGIIFLNPPYDQRLSVENVNEFYKKLGDTFKTNFTKHEAWIITSNKEALKKLGLRASFKTELNNGGTMCKVHQYELYKGSKSS